MKYFESDQIEENLYSDPDFVASYEQDRVISGDDFVEMKNREIVALIAYLQRLGTDIKTESVQN